MIKDFSYYGSALKGEVEYNSLDERIQNVELFLMNWLNGLFGEEECEYSVEEGKMYLEHLYNTFKDDFRYEGVIYRGIAIDNKQEIKTDYLASFTSDLFVAEEFASPYEEDQRSIVFKTETNNAFDFSEFLRKVNTKTTNEDLEIVIEERIDEEEKLHIFQLSEVEEVNCA